MPGDERTELIGFILEWRIYGGRDVCDSSMELVESSTFAAASNLFNICTNTRGFSETFAVDSIVRT